MSSVNTPMNGRRSIASLRLVAAGLALTVALAACGGTEEPEQAGVASVDDLVTTTTEQSLTDSSTTSVEPTTTQSDTPTTETEEMTPIEEQELALLDLSACMRDQGIDNFPDVGVDNNGAIDVAAVLQAGLNPQSPEFTDALEACSDNVADITFGAAALPNPADIADQLFGFTQCLRDEGIDIGDVAVTELLARATAVPADVASREEGIAYFFELDPDDPVALAAIMACESELVGLPGAG